ncbi:b(0,+)-type amino acid transporter 1 [Bulinus truncatus]|nr:b(0,+)-type amino acid transporter 1 [Bulinus truncatus]
MKMTHRAAIILSAAVYAYVVIARENNVDLMSMPNNVDLMSMSKDYKLTIEDSGHVENCASNFYLQLFGRRALGVYSVMVPLGVVISTLGSSNTHIFSGSRIVFSAARDGNLPELLSYIQVNHLTPLSAMVITMVMSLIMLSQADVAMFINYIGFLSAFYNVFIFVAFLRFRLQLFKDIHRPIKLPLVLPVLMMLVYLYIFVAPLAISPQLEYVYVAIVVFGGSAVLYITFIRFKLSLPYFEMKICKCFDVTQVSGNNKKAAAVTKQVELRRELGLIGATSFVIGSIIGSGIFISPKGVLESTGSVALCFIVWVLAGFISLGSALCHAELGTSLQKSGGTYTYLQMGVGNYFAFTYAIIVLLIQTPGVLIIMLMTFSKYLLSVTATCGIPVYLEKLVVAFIVVTLTIVNSYSSRLTSKVTILTTIGKLLALIAIIIGGVMALCQGNELGTGFQDTSRTPSSLALALYSATWATSGGENIAIVVEEIKNPSKTVPRSVIIGQLLVIGVFILVNVSYLTVMTKAEMLQSEAVAVLFGQRALGVFSIIVPLGVMISTLGSSNNHLFGGSRIVFSAARDGNLPEVLSYIQIHQLTPITAMIVTMVMSLIMLSQADIAMFINYIGFLSAFYNVFIFVAFLRFRLQLFKDIHRPIKLPLVLPVLMMLVNLYMFVAPLVISPQLEYVYVAIVVFGGSAVLYIAFIHFKLSLPYFGATLPILSLSIGATVVRNLSGWGGG